MSHQLAHLTSPAFGALVASGQLIVLLPVGSVEPHGPHLALGADTAISQAAAERACELLAADGLAPRIAPAIPYGVTDCAAGFAGAVSITGAALGAYLVEVARALIASGVRHVCVVNNHLEPAHDQAIRGAVGGIAGVTVACPLERRWARTLSAEFKSGACHAGRYETSIVLAHDPALVDDPVRRGLPEVPISLSDQLRAGVSTFTAMGMDQAYAGDPAAATAGEGRDLIEKLADMIATTVREALA